MYDEGMAAVVIRLLKMLVTTVNKFTDSLWTDEYVLNDSSASKTL